jgi:hypothetical protein
MISVDPTLRGPYFARSPPLGEIASVLYHNSSPRKMQDEIQAGRNGERGEMGEGHFPVLTVESISNFNCMYQRLIIFA